jgi:hypothetical protein
MNFYPLKRYRVNSLATAGLNTFNDVIKLTESNIDSIAKVGIAGFLALGAGAVSLAAKTLPIKMGFDTFGSAISALGPHLLKFGLQAAAAYVAIETLSGIWGSFQNTSPLKGISDDLDTIIKKIKEGAGEAGKSIAQLREEKFSKNLSAFEQTGDFFNRGFRAIGLNPTLNSERRADEDTITADEILTKTQAISDAKPDLKIAETQKEREGLALELSILRARRANLTSRDRDELQSNSNREQVIIKRQAELQAPIAKRQSDLEAGIKANRAIADDPLAADSARAKARQQILDDEAQQRVFQAELSRSSDKITDLVVGLRQLTFESSSALRSIEQNSQLKSTQSYQSAILDPRNIGALQGAQAQNEIEKVTARRDIKQQDVNTLQGKLSANSAVLTGLDINPDTTSKEKLDFLKTTAKDGLSEQVIGYVQQYQQAKQELIDSNQNLAKTQYDYLKSIADYNKGLADQNIALKNSFISLQLTARTSIVNLQQQIEQTLIEIDTNSSKAMFQAQRNKIQQAYNKFLEKLGISTDSIFEQLFQNYNSVVDSIQQISERRISRKQSQNTADNRQINNETSKAQTRTERDQRTEQIERENKERQLTNPLNPPSSGTNSPINSSSTGGDNTIYRSQKSGLIIPVVGATNSRGGGYKEDTGLDIMTPIGSKVVASGSGTLEYAEPGHVRQIGEDVDPTTPGFQKQKSIRIKLDNPIEYEGKKYQYQYYTHLREIDPSIYNKGTMSRTPGSREPIRIEAGQFLGETGTAGGGPHLHTGFSSDREQRNVLNYQQVSDVLFGTKDTSNRAVGKVTPLQNNQPIAPSFAQSKPDISSVNTGTVNSSTYTPGGGGMNGGEIDSRGNRLTRNDYAIAIPGQNRVKDQIPYGSTVKLNYGGKTVIAKVTDGGPYIPGRQMDMTTAAAKALRFNGVGQVGVTLQSLPKGADPNKKYYFGEATYKPKFGRGGSVSNAEANKAIASVVQGDKYLTLGKGVQSDANPTPGSIPGGVIDGTGTVDIAKIRREAAAGQPLQEQTINNQLQQQEVDRKIAAERQFSDSYIKKNDTLRDIDTVTGKEKLRQENNVSNQQDISDRTKIDTQIIKNRNFLNREIPASDRKSTELERQAEAYNRSQNRSPYQKIDTLYREYGGIGESATIDNSIIDSRSTIDRLKEESRVRKENILKQIQSIEAYGTGWANLRKTLTQQIKDLKANGFKTEAEDIQTIVNDNDAVLGTPKARQQTIDRLSKQFRALPSNGTAVYDAIAPGASKAIADSRSVSTQYLPKTFDDGLKAEARSIIERFRGAKEALQAEFSKLDEAVAILESEIQAKLKAAGYAPQKLDLTDPKRLELLRKVAPEETAKLEQATVGRLGVSLAGQNLDRNAETAAARSVSIGKRREQLNVDRANTDYLASTQDGNIFSQIQVDKQRFSQGKTDLDLQSEQGAISADLYDVKLKQLGLETNTLRNSLLPLRSATNGFFSDIFAGQGVFDGLGNALRNLTVNILKNFEDLISKQLGQQLFGSLAAGAGDLQANTANGSPDLFSQIYRSISGGLGFGGTSNKPGTPDNSGVPTRSGFEGYQSYGMDVGLNSSLVEQLFKPQVDPIPTNPFLSLLLGQSNNSQQGGGFISGLVGLLGGGGGKGGGGSLLGSLGGLLTGDLFSTGIPGFATGGLVTSPTLALVGEGISNEAIVPLPNGRSIPVDLKGAGESSGNGSNINSSVSVTIQNSGSAKETSRGEGANISQLIKGAVMDVLVNERRAGGLLS